MKLFACGNCGQLLYFENVECERCGHALGFRPEQVDLATLEPEGQGGWRTLADGAPVRRCANAEHDACNWLVPADSPDRYCCACRLNRTIPDLSAPQNLALWRKLEAAKRRLVYGLVRLDVPLGSKWDDPQTGLAFDFLADIDGQGVTTGHENGLITLDIAEADDAQREARRTGMNEPYRTLLGHFRHEVGHYYWMRLVEAPGCLDAFRDVFGDERRDYGAALAAHYAEGPRPDWRTDFISSYAGAHPWEDFAETWAHYLHIVDTLETAWAFGMKTSPAAAGFDASLALSVGFDPYRPAGFDVLLTAWTPLTAAVNSLNDSMGQPPLYPFVLAPTVASKLRFVHGLVHRS